MQIPPTWLKLTEERRIARLGAVRRLTAWGWGGTLDEARARAQTRLERLATWFESGQPARREDYDYGDRPIREECLQIIAGGQPGEEPSALLTRNSYGAVILNTRDLLFLDIDLPSETLGQRLRRFFRPKQAPPAQAAADHLRRVLAGFPEITFRVYRTAAGFRVMAINMSFEAHGEAAQALMQATGTDRAYANLCRSQKCFRARLSPKHWRFGLPKPPGEHPRAVNEQAAFAAWLARYEQGCQSYATCRYLGTVGAAGPSPTLAPLLALHDQHTRATTTLPLA